MNFKTIEKRVAQYELPLDDQVHCLENELIGNRHQERIFKLEELIKYIINDIVDLTNIIKGK